MTLRKPGKVIILPVGSFDPAKPTVKALAAGIEIEAEWNFDNDTPIIELTPGIEAVYVSGERALYDLRSSDWTEGLFHILKYSKGLRGVLGRGRPQDCLYADFTNWIVKDANGMFKVLSEESFDALRAVIHANAEGGVNA